MKLRGRSIQLAVLAFAVIAAAGCSAQPVKKETGSELQASASTADKSAGKEELILAVGGEPDTGFDPTTGWGRYGSPLFQSTLLKRNSEMEIVSDLAASYETSTDGLIWTVKLREDARFSDGEALTADDVVFTYETAKDSSSVVDLTNLDSVMAMDDYTVELTLKQPQSTFVYVLATLGIVPEHAYGDNYAQNPVGSGPFKFVQWDKGQQLIVERNELYYGEKPSFSKLTFLFLEEDAAFAAAKAGTVDAAFVTPAFSTQQIPGMKLESLQSVDNRGIMFPYVPEEGRTTEEGYPIGNDVTADISIRKAINVGIDRDALVEGILEGEGTPAYSISDNLPWWNSDTVFEDGSIEQAKDILAEGGWEDSNGDGTVDKNGIEAEFTLIYSSGDSTRQSLAIAAADMVKPLGIRITVEGKSWDEIDKLMFSNAVLLGFGSNDPLEMYNVYSSQFAGMEYYNPGYYNNPQVDEYMEAALAAADEDEAMELWKKAQWDGTTGLSTSGDAPWAWLVNLNHLYLVNEKLDIGEQQIHPHGHGWPITANIEEWEWKE
ncbi:ABC transporter substrate-binding protein [Paenibacillus shunpengii]|uniref:ABC transporter substrate-binding protein n=1 Tax=Paenibacillus shunpengii TaxID=2054424 RepID=A0ABW5SHB9_9BACL|nr:ABC transporter substrate-binding protein [Paenibacillus sp. FSL H7-0326]OMC72368.1 nickel ABC transporter substrate-binding protein [Paenibacillus sp. FSL H7-0326]